MSQAPIPTTQIAILDTDPAESLSQIDREDRALVLKVLSAAVCTVVVMLTTAHTAQTGQSATPAYASAVRQALTKAERSRVTSPIVGSLPLEARDIPEQTPSLPYAYVHIYARQ